MNQHVTIEQNMKSDERSFEGVVLIADESETRTGGLAALLALSGVTFIKRSTLDDGQPDIPAKTECVLFRCPSTGMCDLQRIANLRAILPEGTSLLTMTDASTSLAEAHKLEQLGVQEVLPNSLTPLELLHSIESWMGQPNGPSHTAPAPAHNGKIITVGQARGGVGSTTVAVNLADQLQAIVEKSKNGAGQKVALLDLDLQYGSTATFLDVPSADGLYHLAMHGQPPDKLMLDKWAASLPSGLTVFTSPARFAPFEALSRGQIALLLDLLKAEFDYIIVDLPRLLVDWIAPVLEQSDRLLLVTDTAVPSIRQARRLIDAYREDALNLPVDMVVNFEKRPFTLKSHHKAAAKVLDRTLNHWLPPDPKTAREAMDRGQPLSVIAPRASLTKAMGKLAQSVLKPVVVPAAKTTKPKRS